MTPKLGLLLAVYFQNLLAFRFNRELVANEKAMCGPGEGSCEMGSCCSEMGFCGTTAEYCSGSQCQLDYSHTCDTLVPPDGSDTSEIPRPRVGKVPYGNWPMITSCNNPGMVALTFDDGPYIYTTELLDLLAAHEVKATFFITGDNRAKGHIDDPATEWPSILRRMYNAGHQVASHTWTHRDLTQVNETVRRAEIIHNEMALRNILGRIPTYIRPPFLECSAGSGCEETLGDLAYHSISANLDTKDYMYDDPALIQRSKDRYSSTLSPDSKENSYIALAHDVHEQTVHNLTEYMRPLRTWPGPLARGTCARDRPNHRSHLSHLRGIRRPEYRPTNAAAGAQDMSVRGPGLGTAAPTGDIGMTPFKRRRW
ncbi:polysaccharide deacetylase, partial [Metarhizium majus ARSEF 297]